MNKPLSGASGPLYCAQEYITSLFDFFPAGNCGDQMCAQFGHGEGTSHDAGEPGRSGAAEPVRGTAGEIDEEPPRPAGDGVNRAQNKRTTAHSGALHGTGWNNEPPKNSRNGIDFWSDVA